MFQEKIFRNVESKLKNSLKHPLVNELDRETRVA